MLVKELIDYDILTGDFFILKNNTRYRKIFPNEDGYLVFYKSARRIKLKANKVAIELVQNIVVQKDEYLPKLYFNNENQTVGQISRYVKANLLQKQSPSQNSIVFNDIQELAEFYKTFYEDLDFKYFDTQVTNVSSVKPLYKEYLKNQRNTNSDEPKVKKIRTTFLSNDKVEFQMEEDFEDIQYYLKYGTSAFSFQWGSKVISTLDLLEILQTLQHLKLIEPSEQILVSSDEKMLAKNVPDCESLVEAVNNLTYNDLSDEFKRVLILSNANTGFVSTLLGNLFLPDDLAIYLKDLKKQTTKSFDISDYVEFDFSSDPDFIKDSNEKLSLVKVVENLQEEFDTINSVCTNHRYTTSDVKVYLKKLMLAHWENFKRNNNV